MARTVTSTQALRAAEIMGLPDPHQIRQIIIDPDKIVVYRYMKDSAHNRMVIPGYRGAPLEVLEYELVQEEQ